MFSTQPRDGGEKYSTAYYAARDAALAEATAWLDERSPMWRDVGAYWDETEIKTAEAT